jgi:surfactin family lipopeptide synthetase A/fengycin family lipopeptide synthetase D
VRAVAAESGTTPYTVLFAAFDTLILGLTGEVDLPVNAVAAGRTRPEFANVVGWFVNRMIVRHRLEPEGSFALLVRGLHERLARDLEHQDYPVAPIAEALRTTADGRPTSLGQLGFYMSRPDHFDDRGFGPLLLEVGDARLRFGSLEVASYPVNAAGADGDLSFREVEVDGRFHFDVRYNADCFERTTVERIVEGYRALLERALAEPELPLARLVGALAFGFGRTAAVSRAAE